MAIFYEANTDVIYKFPRGNTSDIVYVRPAYLDGATIDANWTCKGKVIDRNGNTMVDTYSITEKSGDSTEFKCYLTPNQTAALNPGTGYEEYIWIIQVENSTLTPVIKRDIHFRLGISVGGVI